MSQGRALDIPRRGSPLSVRSAHNIEDTSHAVHRMGLEELGDFHSARAWSTGVDPFAAHEDRPTTASVRASDKALDDPPRLTRLDTSTSSLDDERHSDTSSSCTLPSPAAQWLGSLNSSFGSPADPDASPSSLLQHLRRSSTNRARRPERTASLTSNRSSIERATSTSAPRTPRGDEEGYVFGSHARFRLGRAIGFGDHSTVYEGTALDTSGNGRVAIKLLRNTPHPATSAELQLWLALPRHPHLLSLIHHENVREPIGGPGDAHAHERVLDYLVMDYSPYGNLLQFVRREGAISEPGMHALGSARRVASGSMSTAPSLEPASWRAVNGSLATSLQSSPGTPESMPLASSPRDAPRERPLYRSLSAHRRSRGIPIDVARDIMRQIASGLYSLHKVASVVHCDLKLENILAFPCEEDMGEDTKSPIAWKIADFGLSEKVQPDRHIESWSRAASLGGTLAYAAPEVVRYIDFDMPVPANIPSHAPPMTEQLHTPFARDMWSLGCILYALLSGQLPFMDTMQIRLQRKILAGEFELPLRLRTGKERVELGAPCDIPDEALPYRTDPELDTDVFRMQAREVLENLLDLDPTTRWDIDALCQSPWLALY
ncbi:hypothetical protein MBRA1_000676 [Malassezia brasiliensis]|uniref:Protein kinase domain-containing protein n=1 Tax=Malassezia brasiliensis TaxID=1821822 RepID=A0AAF0DQF4_9BASI|nr:hypothetical protein MBRA1_000676 [Malassezia brasiliensis]